MRSGIPPFDKSVFINCKPECFKKNSVLYYIFTYPSSVN